MLECYLDFFFILEPIEFTSSDKLYYEPNLIVKIYILIFLSV